MANPMKLGDATYVLLVGNDKGARVPVLLINYGPDRLALSLDEARRRFRAVFRGEKCSEQIDLGTP